MKPQTSTTLARAALASVGVAGVFSSALPPLLASRRTIVRRTGGRRVRTIPQRLCLVALVFLIAGCGWLPWGKRRPGTYVTPEGYLGSTAARGPIILDAVYMNDPTKGIEGVVRLTWWDVFSVTVQNRSRSQITISSSQFVLVNSENERRRALPLAEVLSHQSHVVGPLMNYQRRAVMRASWVGEPIAPGAFAVGYVFFPRHTSELLPCRLILELSPERPKDNLVAAFAAPAGKRREPAEEPAPVVPVDTGLGSEEASTDSASLREPEQVAPVAPEATEPEPRLVPEESVDTAEMGTGGAGEASSGDERPTDDSVAVDERATESEASSANSTSTSQGTENQPREE